MGAETWEHEKSKFPNMERFVLWSTWNKKSHHRGIGSIDCYIRKNISRFIQLHKIDHLNQNTFEYKFQTPILRKVYSNFVILHLLTLLFIKK